MHQEVLVKVELGVKHAWGTREFQSFQVWYPQNQQKK